MSAGAAKPAAGQLHVPGERPETGMIHSGSAAQASWGRRRRRLTRRRRRPLARPTHSMLAQRGRCIFIQRVWRGLKLQSCREAAGGAAARTLV